MIFVGRTKNNTWCALVDIGDPDREGEVYKAVGGRDKLFELEGFGEDE